MNNHAELATGGYYCMMPHLDYLSFLSCRFRRTFRIVSDVNATLEFMLDHPFGDVDVVKTV